MSILRTLAATVPMCLAAGASADVIQYDNHDGEFPWGFIITLGGNRDFEEPYLDVTRDATQVGSEPLDHAFVLLLRPYFTSGDWSEERYGGSPSGGDLTIAAGTPVHMDHWFYSAYMDLTFTPPQLFQPGEEVGPASTFAGIVVRAGTVRTQNQNRVPFRLVPENEDYYVGLRFTYNGGTHYGWVRIHEGEPYEWAYESDADLPIQIPGTTCAADWNADGDVNSQDFFDYLSAFFESHPSADFNADKVVNSQDFFDFLGAFFTGC
jgi:hypothetical protein